MGKIRIGTVLRYARAKDSAPPEIDGLPNYFYATHSPGQNMALLEAGINPIQRTKTQQRVPAILISSSPHKVGTSETQWQDFFNPDIGHIRYHGDNKSAGIDPGTPRGNAALLAQFNLHRSRNPADRLKAAPLLFFRRIRVGERSKGNVVFHGFGVIERVDRVVQFDPRKGQSFSNYSFDFAVLSLAAEAEEFDWNWITQRRDDNFSDGEVLAHAPEAWRIWVKEGSDALPKCRRRVSKILVVPKTEQRPTSGSKEERILDSIYRFYDGKKSRFEALAEFIGRRILGVSGRYVSGWITPSSSDGGADFIGRLDLGSGLASVKLIVLGQAKCERPDVPTGGNHIARTVARLRRGWIGIYITTSFFSEAVQREVIEDKYPIVLVDGLRLAREAYAATIERGLNDVNELLAEIDAFHDQLIAQRDPEEILLA